MISVVAGLKEVFVKLDGGTLKVELPSAMLVDKVIVAREPGNEVMFHVEYNEGLKGQITTWLKQ